MQLRFRAAVDLCILEHQIMKVIYNLQVGYRDCHGRFVVSILYYTAVHLVYFYYVHAMPCMPSIQYKVATDTSIAGDSLYR